MNDRLRQNASRDRVSGQTDARRLASWKEIAGHLGVSVRTVQRWERSEHLPVHRHMHGTLGSIYALRAELDAWWNSNPTLRASERQPHSGRSIAVLPFANLSRQVETQALADGLTEEVISTLARVPGLKVVSRTSVSCFKDTGVDLRELGIRLGVQIVLEGSVRRAGDRIRVVAQLIDVATGCHLWSQPFESRRSHAVALQEDVAQAVAAAVGSSP